MKKPDYMSVFKFVKKIVNYAWEILPYLMYSLNNPQTDYHLLTLSTALKEKLSKMGMRKKSTLRFFSARSTYSSKGMAFILCQNIDEVLSKVKWNTI